MPQFASSSDTYYRLLGVPETASTPEIQAAFRRKTLRYYPDKGGDAESFRQIRDAQETLTDRHKRMIYDTQLDTTPFFAKSRASAAGSAYNPKEALKEESRQAQDARLSATFDAIRTDLKEIRKDLDVVSCLLGQKTSLGSMLI